MSKILYTLDGYITLWYIPENNKYKYSLLSYGMTVGAYKSLDKAIRRALAYNGRRLVA